MAFRQISELPSGSWEVEFSPYDLQPFWKEQAFPPLLMPSVSLALARLSCGIQRCLKEGFRGLRAAGFLCTRLQKAFGHLHSGTYSSIGFRSRIGFIFRVYILIMKLFVPWVAVFARFSRSADSITLSQLSWLSCWATGFKRDVLYSSTAAKIQFTTLAEGNINLAFHPDIVSSV